MRKKAYSATISPKQLKSELTLLLLFLSINLFIVIFCEIARANQVPVVRVMVEREKQALKIEGFDLRVSDASNPDRELGHERLRAKIEVRCTLGGRMAVQIGPAHQGLRKLASHAEKPGTQWVDGPIHVESLGGFVRVGNSQFRDDLYVYSFNGDCIVVNHVDLEKYVAGLLNSEMSASWSLNTLMAQAVAARTYAIYQMRESGQARYRGLKPPFDLDSSVRDQVYEGAHMERYRPLQAVQATRGMVLTYNGKPIKAFYHSTCGGRTENPEIVWGQRLPYMRPVQCGHCDRSPRFNWVYSIPTEVIERKLHAEGLLRGKLLGIKVVDRNRMGRASRIEVKGSGGTMMIAATRVRDVIGTVNLRSTDFTIARNPENNSRAAGHIVFVGHGSGHGVGMCQWGAKFMGDKGKTYAQILKWYYPEAQISKLY